MTDAAVRRLSLPASLNSLQAFLEFAHIGAEAEGLTGTERDRLDLVLEELLVNVVRYAYPAGGGEVQLGYAREANRTLRFEISDEGRVFNPIEKAGPDLAGTLENRPVGGLGIFLVRQLVDSLSYRREGGRNVVSFRFPRLEPPSS